MAAKGSKYGWKAAGRMIREKKEKRVAPRRGGVAAGGDGGGGGGGGGEYLSAFVRRSGWCGRPLLFFLSGRTWRPLQGASPRLPSFPRPLRVLGTGGRARNT